MQKQIQLSIRRLKQKSQNAGKPFSAILDSNQLLYYYLG